MRIKNVANNSDLGILWFLSITLFKELSVRREKTKLGPFNAHCWP